MQTYDEPALGWTLVLRRQPVHLAEGRPEGGYTDANELVCCDCGDIPTWITTMSHPTFSGSAGRTGFRRASRHTGSTTGFNTGSRRFPRPTGRDGEQDAPMARPDSAPHPGR